jgi:C_GCAxxG_C_C family probable redox protein
MEFAAPLPSHAREMALARFGEGYNCAEAVLLGLAEGLGLQAEGLPMAATGFGGGMGRQGETCGALTGAILALGLKMGRRQATDLEARENTYAAVSVLLSRFKEIHGALGCRDLIGCDLGTEEGRKKAGELRTHQDICPKFVATATALAAQIMVPKGS